MGSGIRFPGPGLSATWPGSFGYLHLASGTWLQGSGGNLPRGRWRELGPTRPSGPLQMPVKELHHHLTNLIGEELAGAMASARKDVKTCLHAGTSQGLMQPLALLIWDLRIAVSMLDQERRVLSCHVCAGIRRIPSERLLLPRVTS